VRLGWTWDQALDQLNQPVIEAFNRTWAEDCPPLCDMVAGYLQIKPKEKPSRNYDELLAMFPGGVIK
jgi:hypothetical protein